MHLEERQCCRHTLSSGKAASPRLNAHLMRETQCVEGRRGQGRSSWTHMQKAYQSQPSAGPNCSALVIVTRQTSLSAACKATHMCSTCNGCHWTFSGSSSEYTIVRQSFATRCILSTWGVQECMVACALCTMCLKDALPYHKLGTFRSLQLLVHFVGYDAPLG